MRSWDRDNKFVWECDEENCEFDPLDEAVVVFIYLQEDLFDEFI